MVRRAYIEPETSFQKEDVYRKSYNVKDLQAVRRKLAKRANQRMVRLERATSNITGEKYTFGAYDVAQEYLGSKRRFSENLNHLTDINKLRREVSVLQGFLNSKTSTVQGIREMEQKRISTWEKGEWGMKWKMSGIRNKPIKFASTKEFYDFLNSGILQDMTAAGFTSDQAVESYEAAMQAEARPEEEIREVISEALKEFRKKKEGGLKELLERLGNPEALK